MRHLIILLLLLSACSTEEPSVLVGFQTTGTRMPPRGDFIIENNRIITLSQDSLEYTPLWRGCIIAPANTEKMRLHPDEGNGRYLVHDKDTLEVSINQLKDHLFSVLIGEEDYYSPQYLAAVDKKLNTKKSELNEKLTGKSYRFSMKDKEYTVSFHEKNTCIVTQQRDEHFITKGEWFITKKKDYLFLIIDNEGSISKFQISDLSDNFIDTYSFQSETRDKTRFTRLSTNQPPTNNSGWAAIPEEDNLEETILSSPAKSWLYRNDFLVAHDTSTVYSLQPEQDSLVFINWDSKVISADYNVSFSFDVISLDNQKIRVFPTEEDGRVNKGMSRTYQLVNVAQ